LEKPSLDEYAAGLFDIFPLGYELPPTRIFGSEKNRLAFFL